MRTIGILGGMGPQATMEFEARIHAVAQQLIPQQSNTGYPPLVTLYLRHAPVAVDSVGKPLAPLTLDPRLIESARRLGEWVDLLVIPSNTPHFFLDEIGQAAGCEIVSIIDVTIDALCSRGADSVGLVGLGIPQIYLKRLEAAGLRVITAGKPARDALDDSILRLMQGKVNDADRAAAHVAVEEVRSAGAPITVLGCTEIPLLLDEAATADDLINPALLLADAVVRRAIE
jgi:aspartate racemase